MSQADSAGVILIRHPGHARKLLGQSVTSLVTERGADLIGSFTVLEPGQIRINRRPSTR